jgi:hypothetical protein
MYRSIILIIDITLSLHNNHQKQEKNYLDVKFKHHNITILNNIIFSL